MRRYLLRRVLLMVPTFLGIVAITFALAHLAPGDPFQLDLEGNGAAPVAVAQQREAAGLEAPIPVQFGRWLGKVVQLDFGRSFVDGRSVRSRIGEVLPRTALLAGLSFLLAFGLAIPLGAVLAANARRKWARVIEVLLLASWSVPAFWVAVLLLTIFAGPRFLAVLPLQGLEDGGFVLPVICLAWPTLVVVARQVRVEVSTALTRDFVMAARARGIPEKTVVWRHAVPNALLPVLTLAGLQVPHLLGGSVIVERIFGISGMGLLTFDSIGARDYPTIMGATTFMAIVTLVITLLVDVAYLAADPRIRVEAQS